MPILIRYVSVLCIAVSRFILCSTYWFWYGNSYDNFVVVPLLSFKGNLLHYLHIIIHIYVIQSKLIFSINFGTVILRLLCHSTVIYLRIY